jgi:hypothetical protein
MMRTKENEVKWNGNELTLKLVQVKWLQGEFALQSDPHWLAGLI